MKEGDKVNLFGEEFEVIDVYSDKQGLEDGYLIDVSNLGLIAGNKKVDRITIALWEAIEKSNYSEKRGWVLKMLERICRGWRTQWVKWEKTSKNDDERIIKCETMYGKLWAVENERGNYTLMFPSDY